MFLKLYLLPIIFTLITSALSLQTPHEEKLPNNLHIVYTELDRAPISETKLEEITQDIDVAYKTIPTINTTLGLFKIINIRKYVTLQSKEYKLHSKIIYIKFFFN